MKAFVLIPLPIDLDLSDADIVFLKTLPRVKLRRNVFFVNHTSLEKSLSKGQQAKPTLKAYLKNRLNSVNSFLIGLFENNPTE